MGELIIITWLATPITGLVWASGPPLARLLSLFLPGHLLAYTVAMSISSPKVICRAPCLDLSVCKVFTDTLHHLAAKLASPLLCLFHNIVSYTSLCSPA